MRLTGPASLHGAPARAGTARIRCAPGHRTHRGARIHRSNRRTPPPGVAVAESSGGCDVQGRGDHALDEASMVSGSAGRTVGHSRHAPLYRACVRQDRVATPPAPPAARSHVGNVASIPDDVMTWPLWWTAARL
jgi:hypothetical protein